MDKKTREAIEVLEKVNFENYGIYAGQFSDSLTEQQQALTHLITIAEKHEDYHINHATCHECPCKLNFDKMEAKADKYDKVVEILEELEPIIFKAMKMDTITPDMRIEEPAICILEKHILADIPIIAQAIKSKLIGKGYNG